MKDVSVFYIMKMYPAVFARLERSWDGDERSYCHVNILMKCFVLHIELFKYLRTKQKEAIRTYHMELTRAGPICLRYIESAFTLAEKWDITQVRMSKLIIA